MRISINELQMVLDFLKKNSNDIQLGVSMDGDIKLLLTASDANNALITFELFDTENNSMARVSKSTYLHHEVPRNKV